MQTIESKLNYLTIEELDLLDPDPFKVVINKLTEDRIPKSLYQLNAVKELAVKLALIETNRPAKGQVGVYITFNKKTERWICIYKINGINKHIKSSKDKAVVEKAYNEYIGKL